MHSPVTHYCLWETQWLVVDCRIGSDWLLSSYCLCYTALEKPYHHQEQKLDRKREKSFWRVMCWHWMFFTVIFFVNAEWQNWRAFELNFNLNMKQTSCFNPRSWSTANNESVYVTPKRNMIISDIWSFWDDLLTIVSVLHMKWNQVWCWHYCLVLHV